jgi:hypothetical protein
MKEKSIKTEAELLDALGLPGAEGQGYAELLTRDGVIYGVRVHKARFAYDNYSFKATVEIEFEEVDRYRVRVDHPHFASLNRYFENEYGEAREFQRTYEEMSDTTVTAGMVKVQIDNNGKVVAELDADGGAKPLVPQDGGGDEIPF